MAKKHTKILNLEAKLCRFGKISNNTERHGNDWESAFTIPIRELMLTKQELNSFMRDKDCWASWFDTSNGTGVACQPMPWWGGESFSLSEEFEADECIVTISGGKELKFESEGNPKDDEYRAAVYITGITLTPKTGGMTELNCKIYLRPEIGPNNLALQRHQHAEVKLTVTDGRVAERDKKQPQLPMGEPKDESAAAQVSDSKADDGAPSTH